MAGATGSRGRARPTRGPFTRCSRPRVRAPGSQRGAEPTERGSGGAWGATGGSARPGESDAGCGAQHLVLGAHGWQETGDRGHQGACVPTPGLAPPASLRLAQAEPSVVVPGDSFTLAQAGWSTALPSPGSAGAIHGAMKTPGSPPREGSAPPVLQKVPPAQGRGWWRRGPHRVGSQAG